MANKQEQLKEEKLRKNIEAEKAVYTKWEKAAKVQEELRKFQQEKTIERAKKWEERKVKHTNKLKLEEMGRAKESKKYTNKFGDVLKKEREERTKVKDDRHMTTFMKQLQDRDSLMNRYKAEDEEVTKENTELAKRLNGKISEADIKRHQHLQSTSKKHRDHAEYVNFRVKTQEEIDQENFEKKFGKNVKKGIDIKNKIKTLEGERKLVFDQEMEKKNQKMEKVILNKSNELLKVKKKKQSIAQKEVEISQKISQAKVKSALELKQIIEIKRLQNEDNRENREREKAINVMKHAAYFDSQRRKEESFVAFAQEIR